MYVKSTRPSAKREVQKERSAKRDNQIARSRRAQTCALSAPWECARQAGRFFFSVFVIFCYRFSISYKIVQINCNLMYEVDKESGKGIQEQRKIIRLDPVISFESFFSVTKNV